MKFIRDLFNRQPSEFVKLSDLAPLVMPVHLPILLDPGIKNIAHGFSELTEWVRIGFDPESKKGPYAEALYIALRGIANTLEHATPVTDKDGAPGVYLRRDDLRVLRATSWQITEAAANLRYMGAHMKPAPDIHDIVDNNGQHRRIMDMSNVIPIYNRPNADHALAAAQIEDCMKSLNGFLGNRRTRPAGEATVQRYADILKLLR